jgi:hypothetical protein
LPFEKGFSLKNLRKIRRNRNKNNEAFGYRKYTKITEKN